jgi:hypothetical protein
MQLPLDSWNPGAGSGREVPLPSLAGATDQLNPVLRPHTSRKTPVGKLDFWDVA